MGDLSDWVANNTPHPYTVKKQDDLRPRLILPRQLEGENILQAMKWRFNGSPLKFQSTIDGDYVIEFPMNTAHEGLILWLRQITDFINSLQGQNSNDQYKPESTRDTQFAGFAKLLLTEIDDAIGRITERLSREEGELDEKQIERETAHELGTIIARRAYDLVRHVLTCIPQIAAALPSAQTVDEVLPFVLDLTEWPKEEQEP